jgi:hypothetical protein
MSAQAWVDRSAVKRVTRHLVASMGMNGLMQANATLKSR